MLRSQDLLRWFTALATEAGLGAQDAGPLAGAASDVAMLIELPLGNASEAALDPLFARADAAPWILGMLRVYRDACVAAGCRSADPRLGRSLDGASAAGAPRGARLARVRWRLEYLLTHRQVGPDLADVVAGLRSDHRDITAFAMTVARRLPPAERKAAAGELLSMIHAGRQSIRAFEVLGGLVHRDRSTLAETLPDEEARRFHGSPRARARAALLRRMLDRRSPLGRSHIRQGLMDPVAFYRLAAVRVGLPLLPAAARVAGLVPLLQDPSYRVYQAAIGALTALGPAAAPALPAIRVVLETGPQSRRTYLGKLLVTIGPAAIPLLRAGLQAEIQALTRGREQAETPVLRYLREHPAGMRALLPEILTAAKSEVPAVASEGLWTLGALGVRPGDPGFPAVRSAFVARLVRLRKGPGDWVAFGLMHGLRRLGPGAAFAVPEVLEGVPGAGWFGGRNPDVQLLQLLATIGADGAVLAPLLRRVVRRTDGSAREARHKVLPLFARLGPAGARLLPDVTGLLTEPENWEFVFQAWAGLAPHAGDRAPFLVETLLRAMPRNSYLQHYASEVVANMGGRGIELLVARIGEHSWAGTRVLRTVAMKHPALAWRHRLALRKHMIVMLEGLVASKVEAPFMLDAGRELRASADARIRGAAYRLLSKAGAAALPYLREDLQAHPERSKEILAAAHAIGPAADELVRDQVALSRSSKDPALRLWLLRTLPKFGRRGVGALEMSGLPPAEIGPILADALRSQDPGTRRAAARALISVRFESRRTLPAVTQLLRVPDPRDRSWAAAAFCHLLPEAERTAVNVANLGDLWLTSDPSTRRRLAQTMGTMAAWGDEVLWILGCGVEDPDPAVRRVATRAVVRWGAAAKELRTILRGALEDASSDVREAAERALRGLDE